MVLKGTEYRAWFEAAKGGQFPVCQLGAAAGGEIEAGERTDPVHTARISLWLVIREFEIGPGLDGLADILLVVLGFEDDRQWLHLLRQ